MCDGCGKEETFAEMIRNEKQQKNTVHWMNRSRELVRLQGIIIQMVKNDIADCDLMTE